MTNPIRNSNIYYTTDGSDPTLNSQQYLETIKLNKTTVLKVVIFKNNKQLGDIKTHDYFINVEHDLPIVSLSTNPENLWDEDVGIYNENNCLQRGLEWQRPAVISFYELDENLGFSRKIGLRIHGGGSSNLPQKSLRVYFLNKYNENEVLNYPIFPKNKTKSFYSLILRNGGTDWGSTFFRDALMQEIVEEIDSNLDLQDYRPVVVYLNGQYWGIYNIRERQDEYYFANKYGANLDKIVIYSIPLDIGVNRGLIEVDEGDDKEGKELFNGLLNSTRACENCIDINAINKHLDINNLVDYFIIQFHFNNYDWPYGNAKLWRYKTDVYEPNAPEGLDGRFRWMVFDLEVGWGSTKTTIEGIKDSAQSNSYKDKLIDDRFPFKNLFNDHTFRATYINRYADFLNTVFKEENLIKKINELRDNVDSEMPRHIEHWHNKTNWGDLLSNEEIIKNIITLDDYDTWKQRVDLLEVWALDRGKYMKQYTVDYFNLSGMSKINLSTNNSDFGSIQVNTIIIDGEDMPWSGDYFNDLKLKITAIPKKGHKFVNWMGDYIDNKSELTVLIEEDINLTAVFE